MYIVIFLYGVYHLFSSFSNQSFESNSLMICNLVVISCLILSRFNVRKAEQGSQIEVDKDIEDTHQIMLERKAYTAVTYIQIAATLSFIGLLVGFLLLRNTQPVIAMWSGILLMISAVSLFPSQKIVSITNPNFTFPNPKSKNYELEFINQFDDGEKYVILKGLFKLHSLVLSGLVILAFILMFYSAITGNSQLISIIGIGVLLLLIQVSYTISLKPSKLK